MSDEKTVRLSPLEDFSANIKRMEPNFRSALPAHISPEKFMRAALTAIQLNPDILSSDKRTLFLEITKAAQDGLLIDGREAAIVVFKTKNGPVAKYMPMLGGVLKKLRNSGELANITAQIVYDGDDFNYWIDEQGEHIKHTPKLNGTRGKPSLTYAIARTRDGDLYTEVMTYEQIQDVKNSSKAKDFGPWSGPFESEMWRKTVIRRLAKRLPMSSDLEEVVRRDDDLFDFKNEPQRKKITSGEEPTRLVAMIAGDTVELDNFPPRPTPPEVTEQEHRLK